MSNPNKNIIHLLESKGLVSKGADGKVRITSSARAGLLAREIAREADALTEISALNDALAVPNSQDQAEIDALNNLWNLPFSDS